MTTDQQPGEGTPEEATTGSTPTNGEAAPGTSMVPAATTAPVPVVSVAEPTPPPDMSAEDLAALRTRVKEAVEQLANSTGSKEMEVVDSITSVGIQAQRQAGSEMEILRARVGDMISQEGASGQIAKDLVDLRVVLNRINPNENNQSPVQRFISLLPFSKNMMSALERVAVRYETVSSQAVVIEKRLRDGQLMLRRDNIELRKLYEQVEQHQMPVKRNAFFGELLMAELQKLLDATTEPRKRDRIQNALYDVSVRVQDLRTMEAVHNQFFVSLEMTRENNGRLSQAVDRTLSLTTNTLMVGLAIQSALARQKRVLEATQRTREFLGELIVGNAAAIKQHTAEIGDVYKNPVVAIDKLTQAHQDLMDAIDAADRMKAEGITQAHDNIVRLRQLSAQLEQKALVSTGSEDRTRETPSLEA